MTRKNLTTYILMFISLFLVALYTNIYTVNLIDLEALNFNTFKDQILWFCFSVSWCAFFVFIFYLIKNKKAKLLSYTIFCSLANVLLFAQICYTQDMAKFMIFSDLFVASEGLQYIGTIFAHMDLQMVLIVLINIMLMISIWFINKKDSSIERPYDKKYIIFFIVFILLFRIIGFKCLGKEDTDFLAENYNVKNIYNNYTNPNTSMFVSGFYEYTFRSVYKYFSDIIFVDKEKLISDINKYNKEFNNNYEPNEYTGIFKDKNVVFVMMESIDSWVIDDKTMPTLNYLSKTGLNFNKRYSPFFNGGQTINSEFALNTGMYSITRRDTIFELDDIDYKYSLANMLKKYGYTANSFHANSGSFYNRSNFHKLLGYDNHYSFYDMQDNGILNDDVNYFSDSAMITDDFIYNLINKDEKYISFITTYSAHLDYKKNNSVFQYLDQKFNADDYYSEEEYIYKTLANDTDEFLRILIEKLTNSDAIDNTVLVLASDHYVYGFSDTDYIKENKNATNVYELQNTPFIIWSKDIEGKEIDTIMDTADVLPTLLNMLGIEYNPNNYLGTDVFSSYHDKFVWFSDGTYIKDADCDLNDKIIMYKVKKNILKNQNILITNYYGD